MHLLKENLEMQTNKRLKKIEKNSFELGNDAYKTYKEIKSLRKF